MSTYPTRHLRRFSFFYTLLTFNNYGFVSYLSISNQHIPSLPGV